MRALDELVGPHASEGVPLGKTPREPELQSTPQPEPSLKGQAVELWRDGDRLFIVADEADAQAAMQRFSALRGEIWTRAEIELVERIPDQAICDEILRFKLDMDGKLSPDLGEGVSPEEWKAGMLNRLFQEQGVTGQLGRITAETIRHRKRARSHEHGDKPHGSGQK